MKYYLKTMEKEVIIGNSLSEIVHVTNFIKDLGSSLQLATEDIMSISVALEEAIANVVENAYPAGDQRDIRIKVDVQPQELVFQLIDDGISFYEMFERESSLSQEHLFLERLGTRLIRTIMDEVSYESINGQNVLTMRKHMVIEIKNEKTMRTNICKIEGVTILTIDGRLDTANAHGFELVIQPLMEEIGQNLIVNCENFTYICSSGIRVFLLLQKRIMKNNGSLIFEAMKPEIRRIFDMTGCSSIFTIR